MPSVISHSEVDQFLTCERKHYYAFGKVAANGESGLQSKHISDGLFKGNLGHAALEAYYKYIMQFGETPPSFMHMQNAKQDALEVINNALKEFPDKTELILGMYQVIAAYCDKWIQEDQFQWQVMAVEVEFREEVNAELTFPFKPDLIRRDRRTGRVEVIDHKFLTNLYNSSEIAIQPQLPKYVGSLRNLGYEVDDGVYDLVGTRVLKTKPYDAEQQMRRVPLKITENRVNRSLLEQYRIVNRIAELKQMDNEVWAHTVNRTANSFNCKNCPFLALCIADLNGEDTSVMVKYEFESNSYGYDKKESVA